MSSEPSQAQRGAYWREGLLLAGFVLLVIAGIATVAWPELSKTPEEPGHLAKGAPAQGAPASPAKPK